MTLPESLLGIFKNRQSSYKMVLVLTLLDEMDHTGKASIKNIVTRFRAFYRQRVEQGLAPEKPKLEMNAWEQMSSSQIRSLILSAPFKYLNSVLEKQDAPEERIGFRPEVWAQMTSQNIEELRAYAEQSLKEYYDDVKMTASFREFIHQFMSNYLEAKRQSFAGHPLGNLVRRTIADLLHHLPFIGNQYKIQGSVGQGNWANIPWVAIMDKRVTETTQKGVYVCYLFSEDMNSLYLTLMQGVKDPQQEKGKREGNKYLRQKVEELRNLLPLNNLQKDDQIFLTRSGIGQDYQVSTIAYIRYDRDNLPNDEELIADLENILENYKIYIEWISGGEGTSNEPELNRSGDIFVYGNEHIMTVAEQVQHIKNFINQKGFTYPELLIENFFLSLKTKPFVLLAGISGTGKTKLVKLFAEAVGATESNGQFALIPVRPDWSDPSDLFGYTDLSGTFRPGRMTEVLLNASKPENQDKPYFICLDEMNLARVEHYFSDVLSILETQRWEGQHIITDKIIQNNSLSEEGKKIYGDLRIPENVYLIGTVNMDETTHPFSKKVLDRANTLEFNFIDLNDLPRLEIKNSSKVEPIEIGQLSFRSNYLFLQEAYPEHSSLIQTTTEKLVKINQILEEIHAHVGFRVRDTICFFMVYNERFGLMEESQAFDLQLTQKILPRLQGSSSAVKRTLIELMKYTTNQNFNIEEMMADASPLYDQWRKPNQLLDVLYPKSARKIAFMLRRFEEDGFTSFWLS